MKSSSYRGEHKGSTMKARSKIYASRMFRLALAFVLAVSLTPGLSYAGSALDAQPSDGEVPATVPERTTEPVEGPSDVNESDQEKESQQPEQQPDQQEGQQPEQQPDQQERQQPEQQSDQQPSQQPDQRPEQHLGGLDQGNSESDPAAMDVDADAASTLGTAESTLASAEITYSPSTSKTENVTIDGAQRTVPIFDAKPTMTVIASGIDFDTNKSRIVITNVLTGDPLTELWGANTWTQLDGSVTGRWKAEYTIKADGRYKVEVKPNGVLAKTDYVDVDLVGPQVDVTLNKEGANAAGDKNYFKEKTSATVTVKDRHFDKNTVTPRVSSPSATPYSYNTFFGAWKEITDSDGNVVYTSTSSDFEESALGGTYKFGVTAKDTSGHQTVYAYGDNAEADTAAGTGAKTTKDSAGTVLKGTNGFVVDTTRPTVAVKTSVYLQTHTANDNDNGTDYFSAITSDYNGVRATIVVTDNNFNKDDPNNTVNIVKANGTVTNIQTWFKDNQSGNQDYKEGQWTYTIDFPQSKWGEKYSFSFTATDWAGLTTEYKYGDNNAATSSAGATSTVDNSDGHGDPAAKKLTGSNFVVDVSQPNVNVTMGSKRVYADAARSIDGFNSSTVTVAIDDASFDANATGNPKVMVVSGSNATETEAGIKFDGWKPNEQTKSDEMIIDLPDSKKNESYRFTLAAKSLVTGETAYNYGDVTGEPEQGHGGAISTKDSAGGPVTPHGSFIIDTTKPKLGVSFETEAINTAGEKTGLTRYYDASTSSVVAKVSVTDIHLDTSRISAKVYESDGTTEASGYTVSSWVDGDAEDTKVATVTINKPATDKTYVLKVTGDDLFENQIESADESSTYVEPATGTTGAYYQSKVTFDSQAPKITVGWGDTATNGKYYNADREATITVLEANFDASRMRISQDGGSTWTTTAASDWGSNGAYSTYMGSLKDFESDGTFQLQVKGADFVGNLLEAGAASVSGMSTQQVMDAGQAGNLLVAGVGPVDDGKPADTQQGSISNGTYESAEFVIDKTAPTATITWDNNDAFDGNCYDSPRTATITVVERNFLASDFAVQTAGTVGGWSDDGDTHTCTVSFSDDGRYTLSVSGHDRAGNAMDTMVEPEFVIDRTVPTTSPAASTANPVASAANHHDGTSSKASSTTGAQTPHLGDNLFELILPLVVGCLLALLTVIVLVVLLSRRRAKLR